MTMPNGVDFIPPTALLGAVTEFPPMGWAVIAVTVLGIAALYGTLRYFAPSPEELAEAAAAGQDDEEDEGLLNEEEFTDFVLKGSIPSLVRIVENGQHDSGLAQVLEQVQRQRNRGFQIGAVRASTIRQIINEKADAKHLQDTFTFARYPQLALFRNGELVTTLDPYYDNDLTTLSDMSKRIRSFLIKMGI